MLEYNYALQLQFNLEHFNVKKTNPLLINFRCPLCGDSKSSKTKARAYIIQQSNGKYYFYCHNCHVNQPFARFLEYMSPVLFQQYRMDKFKADPERAVPETFKKKKIHFQNIEMLQRISSLYEKHLARRYCDSRQIPLKMHYKLYYCHNFYEFLKDIDPEKALYIGDKPQPRLIIPFTDASGTVTAITARSLNGSEPKYLVVVFDEDALQVFGLDTVDFGKRVYVTEGPIDSMFIDNGLALGGQHYNENFESYVSPFKDNIVFVYDNEPRNKYTVKAMRKTIKDGYGVVLWPEIAQKDINEMVLAGTFSRELLEDHTYRGLMAETKLAAWSKS